MAVVSGGLIVDIIVLIFAGVGAYFGFKFAETKTAKGIIAIVFCVLCIVIFLIVLLALAGISLG